MLGIVTRVVVGLSTWELIVGLKAKWTIVDLTGGGGDVIGVEFIFLDDIVYVEVGTWLGLSGIIGPLFCVW